ncbi:MAG: hypothetical protein ACFFBD_19570 [Candidatus Hodarchaeota archaeon]
MVEVRKELFHRSNGIPSVTTWNDLLRYCGLEANFEPNKWKGEEGLTLANQEILRQKSHLPRFFLYLGQLFDLNSYRFQRINKILNNLLNDYNWYILEQLSQY